MKCDPNKKLTLDALVGRLTTFELDNIDNYVPSSKVIESSFKDNLSLKEKGKNEKSSQSRNEVLGIRFARGQRQESFA